jgi:hypothetical protein
MVVGDKPPFSQASPGLSIEYLPEGNPIREFDGLRRCQSTADRSQAFLFIDDRSASDSRIEGNIQFLGYSLEVTEVQRKLPVWPSEYRPGCGQTVRPWGSFFTGIVFTVPVVVSMT